MPLNFQQRRKRAMVMRRMKVKIQRARERAARRLATTEKLKLRARRAAIKIVRRRVAGKLGMNYADLSASQKMQIDQKVAKRKGMIEKIARKILPAVRRKEIERYRARQAAKNDK